ncbi:MAG: hypothetical protein F9K34_11105 [Albidovulum sp.]|uniref:hypothetical protein n=1 Tax=Albidovulum sp. TaxID=1872424 RepID=UPI001321B3BC|nr:hypothetical protein [Defluviimonas sp.]KAB2883691.1 MAG: hypothetical protein F9K34_11105 [Defluviimonas sp.]
MSEKSRENRARRRAKRLGFWLKKMPARSWMRGYYPPGFTLLSSNNVILIGARGRGFEATLDEVEAFIARYE